MTIITIQQKQPDKTMGQGKCKDKKPLFEIVRHNEHSVVFKKHNSSTTVTLHCFSADEFKRLKEIEKQLIKEDMRK